MIKKYLLLCQTAVFAALPKPHTEEYYMANVDNAIGFDNFIAKRDKWLPLVKDQTKLWKSQITELDCLRTRVKDRVNCERQV